MCVCGLIHIFHIHLRRILLNFTRCPLVNLPTKPSGVVEKMSLFSLSLNFFTFTRRSRKIKHFFCKKNRKKNAQKIALFSFSRRCFIFKIFIFYITFQLEKMKKKSLKKSQKSNKKTKFF